MSFLGIGGRDKKNKKARELSVTERGAAETEVVGGHQFLGDYVVTENNVDKLSKKLGLQVLDTPVKETRIDTHTQYHFSKYGDTLYAYRFGVMNEENNGSFRIYNMETGEVEETLPNPGFDFQEPRQVIEQRGGGFIPTTPAPTMYVLYNKRVHRFRRLDNTFIESYVDEGADFRGIAAMGDGRVVVFNSPGKLIVFDRRLKFIKELTVNTNSAVSEICNGPGNTVVIRESGGNVHLYDINDERITHTNEGADRVFPMYNGENVFAMKIKAAGDYSELSVQKLSRSNLNVIEESNVVETGTSGEMVGAVKQVVFGEGSEAFLLFAPPNSLGGTQESNSRLFKLEPDMRLLPIVMNTEGKSSVIGAGFEGSKVHLAVREQNGTDRIVTATKDLQIMGYVENDNSGILSVETTGGSGSTGGNTTIVEHADEVSIMPLSDQFYLEETWGDVSANNSLTVLNTADPCIINKLTFVATNKESRISIRLRDSTGSLQNSVKLPALFSHSASDGGLAVSAENLNNAGSETDSWKEFIYDEDSERYALALKDKLYAPTGLEITVEARGNTNSQIGCIGQVLFFDK